MRRALRTLQHERGVPAAPERLLFYFLVGLLAFKLLYIPCELSLNSVLAQTYASSPNDAKVHAVEFLGRSLSGIAVAFLVVRLSLKRRLPSTLAAWLVFMAVLLCIDLAVVFGQKAIVNNIAARASAGVRREAVLLRTLPSALRAHHTDIPGFTVRGDDGTSRTFVALAPALEFYDLWESRHLQKHLDEVLYGTVVANAMAGNMTPAWREFKRFSDDYHHAYNRYANASRDVARAATDAKELTDRMYAAIRTTSNTIHEHFASATSSDSVLDLHYRLTRYFNYRIWFPRRSQREYDAGMQALFGEHVEPELWCNVSCPGSIDFVAAALRSRLIRNSLERARIDPRHGYDERSAALANIARDALAPFGGRLPLRWRLTDRATFRAVAERALHAATLRNIADSTRQRFGRPIPPGLDYVAFSVNRDVQNAERYEVLHHFGAAPAGLVNPDWQRARFEALLLQPALRNARSEEARVFGPVSAYRDGGPLADRGRRAVVALLVPVVSLALSLFFGLWNLLSAITLVVTLREFPRYERVMQRATWAAGAMVCVLPFTLPFGLAASAGYAPAIAHVRAHSPAASTVLGWLARTEPGVLGFADLNREIVWRITRDTPMNVARRRYHLLASADCLLIRDCSNLGASH